MQPRSGIPLLSEANEYFQSDLCRRMLEFDRTFVEKYGPIIRPRAMRRMDQPMRQWSRRWEYPFVAQRLLRFVRNGSRRPMNVLDAGSGVTFFPYYLCSQAPGLEVICCDRNRRYGAAFEALARATGAAVTYVPTLLQRIPRESLSLDAIYCISVLEHTGEYEAILDEFRRVLRPGGLLAMTFDISLDGKSTIQPGAAMELIQAVAERFDMEPGLDYAGELARLARPRKVFTTDAVRKTDPALLPWRWPRLKSVYDLFHGRGWSGGFFSLTVCCLAATAKA